MAFAEEKDPVDTLGMNGHWRILAAPGESLHRITGHVAGRADLGMASFRIHSCFGQGPKRIPVSYQLR
jgi:hypothetical protein